MLEYYVYAASVTGQCDIVPKQWLKVLNGIERF